MGWAVMATAFRVRCGVVSSGWSVVADRGRAVAAVGMGCWAVLCEGSDVMGGGESGRV